MDCASISISLNPNCISSGFYDSSGGGCARARGSTDAYDGDNDEFDQCTSDEFDQLDVDECDEMDTDERDEHLADECDEHDDDESGKVYAETPDVCDVVLDVYDVVLDVYDGDKKCDCDHDHDSGNGNDNDNEHVQTLLDTTSTTHDEDIASTFDARIAMCADFSDVTRTSPVDNASSIVTEHSADALTTAVTHCGLRSLYRLVLLERLLIGSWDSIPLAALDRDFEFVQVYRTAASFIAARTTQYDEYIAVESSVGEIVQAFGYFLKNQLKDIARCYGVSYRSTWTRQQLMSCLRELPDQLGRPLMLFVFKALPKDRWRWEGFGRASAHADIMKRKRQTEASAKKRLRLGDSSSTGADSDKASHWHSQDDSTPAVFPPRHNPELIRLIIQEYQDSTAVKNLQDCVCACCGELTARGKIKTVLVEDVDFTLLRNHEIPTELLPSTYNLSAYDGAILHPKGLSSLNSRSGYILLCEICRRNLVYSRTMPPLALANFFYYAFDKVPPAVQKAFQNATFVDRRLVARCGATKICFRYMDNPDSKVYNRPLEGSQRYSRGNVIVLPLDNMVLNNLLPPALDEIRDSFVAVFVGNEPPTPEVLRKVEPVMSSSSIVRTIIGFLLSCNPAYTVVTEDFPRPSAFSQHNFDSLYGPDAQHESEKTDSVLLPCVEIGHIHIDPAQQGSDSDVSGRNEFDESEIRSGDFLMEPCGYALGERTDKNYREMKAAALARCLDKKPFLLSRRGSKAVHDFRNPYTLTWMFPHLDPFGLGGFDDHRRKKHVSMKRQLSHLLKLADGRFREDPTFAFVFHNILQKRQALRNVRFRIPSGVHERIVSGIQDVPAEVLHSLAERLKVDRWTKPANEAEAHALSVMNKIHMIRRDVPGSDAYKCCRRNEIRALINFLGAPAFFLTLTPNDIDSLLVALAINKFEDSTELLNGTTKATRWERAMKVARNAAAAAKVFHESIQRFMQIVLRVGKGEGLFGPCTGVYGMVEAQGRGTLHCHMLIWIKGNMAPARLREELQRDPQFRERMFQWLERHIKTELPDTTHVVQEQGVPLQKPQLAKGVTDPRTIPGPSIRDLPAPEFQKQFNEHVRALVVESNWHEHRSTCWIYLKPGEEPSDAKCRMRIDGSTRAETVLDEESGAILLRRLHPRINEYNDVIMFLFKCNMDIQYIGSGEGAKAALYYITDYITKPSLTAHAGLSALMYAIQRNDEKYKDMKAVDDAEKSRSLLNKMVNAMMARQEMSHQQIMSQYVGGGDVYASHEFRVLRWGIFDRYIRTIESTEWPEKAAQDEAVAGVTEANLNSRDDLDDVFDDIQTDAPAPDMVLNITNGRAYACSQQQDYVYRPSEFGYLCLFDFVRCVDKRTLTRKQTPEDSDIEDEEDTPVVRDGDLTTGLFDSKRKQTEPEDSCGSGAGRLCSPEHPQYATHVMRLRESKLVPVILGPTLPRRDRSPEEKERWCRAMIILFKPWRCLNDLKTHSETWTVAFERYRFEEMHLHIMDSMDVLHQCKDARDDHMARRRDTGLERSLVNSSDELYSLEQFEESTLLDERLDPSFDGVSEIEQEVDVVTVQQLLPERYDGEVLQVVQQMRVFEGVPVTCSQEGELTGTIAEPSGSVNVREITQDDRQQLRELTAIMSEWKKEKRPQYEEEQSGSQRNTAVRDPETSVTVVTDAAESSANCHEESQDPVQTVISELSMAHNLEQCRALKIVAAHVISGSLQQLFMYVGGVGGTGKSHVIRGIVRLFSLLGIRESLVLSAPTGAAAVVIKGFTIHALTLLPQKKNTKTKVAILESVWRGVRYLIIDEISMVSAAFLSEVSQRICMAKGTSDGIPFGGVNVIFTGDFGQLKPFASPSLFHSRLVSNVALRTGQRIEGQSALNGAFLWRQLNEVVLLRRNMRQAEDPAWANLLSRIRVGQAWRGGSPHNDLQRGTGANYEISDYDVLLSRQLSVLQENFPEEVRGFRDAPVIVATRKLRDALNTVLSRQHAIRLGQEYQEYFSKDSFKGRRLTGEIQQRMWRVSSRITEDALGKLPLFVGMRVMVTDNIAISKNIVNGATGTVVGLKYDVGEDGRRMVVVVYVHLPGCGVRQPGLPEDVVWIQPDRSSFSYKFSTEDGQKITYSVSRAQVPLVPAYSYTDYKSQGRSLDVAIVDLAGCHSLQSLYVMLSRVRTLKGVALLRYFPASRLYRTLQSDMRSELERLERLDSETRHRLESAPTKQGEDAAIDE